MFVLPISKPGGFMTLLLNWQGPVALLTSVEEYKRFGAGAPPHMTITHYPGDFEAEAASMDRPGCMLGFRSSLISRASSVLSHAPNASAPAPRWPGRPLRLAIGIAIGLMLYLPAPRRSPPLPAPPPMTELAESKGLVLLRGDIINDAVVSLAEVRSRGQ
jgi:hypothetical protein